MIYNNGDYYIGPLDSGSKCNFSNGKMIYANGDVYVGQWIEDQKTK